MTKGQVDGTRGRWWRIAVLMLMVAGVTAGVRLPAVGSTEAAEAELFTVEGMVTDRSGVPLADVVVSHAGDRATTDESGWFSIGFDRPGRFSLTASRADVVPHEFQWDVPMQSGPMRLALLYRLEGGLGHPSSPGSAGAPSVVLTAESTAPEGTCIVARLQDGESVALDAVRQGPNRSNVWSAAVPGGTARLESAGQVRASIVGRKCEGGTLLTDAAEVTAVPDGSAPVVDRTSLFPPEDGNTIHLDQPIVAMLHEPEPGLDLSSVKIVVRDASESTITARPDVAVSEVGASDFKIQSDAVPLQRGHRYRVELSANDLDGNQAKFSWHFRHVVFDAEDTTVEIPAVEGVEEEDGSWQFLPTVSVSAFEVESSPVEHSGWGPVGHRIPLSNAYIEYELADAPLPVKAPAYPAEATVTVFKQFQKLASESSNTKTLYGQQVQLAPISIDLPPTVTGARLLMDPVIAPSHVPASECAEPNPSHPACSTDPLRFFIAEDFSSEIAERQLQERQDLEETGFSSTTSGPGLSDAPATLTQFVEGAVNDVSGEKITHWDLVSLDTGYVASPYEEEVIGFLEGVSYPGTVWPQTPVQFSEACAVGYACTSTAAASDSTESIRNRCVLADGHDRPVQDAGECRQMVIINIQPPYQSGTNEIGGWMVSQIGFADHVRSPGADARPKVAFEELGVAWNDESGWSYEQEWRWSYGQHKYWCDGDEDRSHDQEPTHLHWKWDYVSGGNSWSTVAPVVQIDPYGFGHPNFRQYVLSDMQQYEDLPYCHGRYVPGMSTSITREPLSRTYRADVDSSWTTYQPRFNGTAIVSWGHVWTEYAYDWKASFKGGCSSASGCSAFAGFEFRPYERQKSALAQYPVSYCVGYSDCQ